MVGSVQQFTELVVEDFAGGDTAEQAFATVRALALDALVVEGVLHTAVGLA